MKKSEGGDGSTEEILITTLSLLFSLSEPLPQYYVPETVYHPSINLVSTERQPGPHQIHGGGGIMALFLSLYLISKTTTPQFTQPVCCLFV